MDGRTRGTTVDRGTRSGVRRTGTCRRRRQAAQDRLGRRGTAIDRTVGGAHPRRASGRGGRPDRNSRAGLARKLCAGILLRTPDRGTRPAHRTAVARRLRAHIKGRQKVAENSTLSSIDLQLSKPAMTRSVDALLKLKMVERQRNPEDRRKVFVGITTGGWQLLRNMGVS